MTAKEDNDQAYAYEYIGSEIEVVHSDHEAYMEITGKVIDETKNTFVIRDEEDKMIPKEGNRFEIRLNDRWITLDGSSIAYRPEDRIKKLG